MIEFLILSAVIIIPNIPLIILYPNVPNYYLEFIKKREIKTGKII